MPVEVVGGERKMAGGWVWRGCVTDAVLLYFRLPGDRRQGSSRCARQAEMSGCSCRPQTCQVVPGLQPIYLRVKPRKAVPSLN